MANWTYALRVKRRFVAAAVCVTLVGIVAVSGQRSSGPAKGTLILDGGGTSAIVRDRFVSLAGGAKAHVVVIPTGVSSLRFGEKNTILDPDWPRDRPEWSAYEAYLKQWLGTENVTVIHTRDRKVADSEDFVRPLRTATGVFLSAGNAGRHAEAYLDTRTQKELEALLARGGVIFGSSAGAIIQGSYTVRGRADKPLLMAAGHERGFGFLRNVAINPHLTQAKRENELINVVDAHPEILGIGIDEDAALVVRGNRFEVIGAGRVAIYDNKRREGWYYWLKPGEQFNLETWTMMVPKNEGH